MPTLPLESPGGLSFALGSDTAGVKLSPTTGVYMYDAVNGTVNVANVVDSLRQVTLTIGADIGNSVAVVVSLTDAAGNAVNEDVRLHCSILGLAAHGATFSASTTAGTAADLSATGATELLVNTDAATGDITLNIGSSATSVPVLTVRSLTGAAVSGVLNFS